MGNYSCARAQPESDPGISQARPEAVEPIAHGCCRSRELHGLVVPEVRSDFRHADIVGKYTVFDVGGNKFRLIATIKYRWQVVYIREILSHADYDRGHGNEHRSVRFGTRLHSQRTPARVLKIDPRKYGRLLGKAAPAVIETEEESAANVDPRRRLMDKDDDSISPEEGRLQNSLAMLLRRKSARTRNILPCLP